MFTLEITASAEDAQVVRVLRFFHESENYSSKL
jgi:hypothetical protein